MMATKHSVRGHDLPPPRPTAWAMLYVLLFLGLPLLLLLGLVDFLLYVVFEHLLGRCYGIFCWLD